MHGRHILYLKLHVHGRIQFYQRSHASVQLQVMHPCTPPTMSGLWKPKADRRA